IYQRMRGDGEGGGEQGMADVPVEQAIQVSADIVTRVANTFFVLVLTFYLMVEGDRAWKVLSRYFTPRLRYRIRRSYPEISRVVSGYLVGQRNNPLSFGVITFSTMRMLGVQEALLLAVLSTVCDAVAIVGVPGATIPPILLALTVPWQTAAHVVVLYVVY